MNYGDLVDTLEPAAVEISGTHEAWTVVALNDTTWKMTYCHGWVDLWEVLPTGYGRAVGMDHGEEWQNNFRTPEEGQRAFVRLALRHPDFKIREDDDVRRLVESLRGWVYRVSPDSPGWQTQRQETIALLKRFDGRYGV